MRGRHGGGDAAADGEAEDDFQPSRVDGGDDIGTNFIGDGFVEGPFVAIGPEIEFPRFQFDTEFMRDVADQDRGEIRLARLRTEAREFRAFAFDEIIPLRLRIGKRFELFGRCRRHRRESYVESPKVVKRPLSVIAEGVF